MDIKDQQLKLIGKILRTENKILLDRLEMLFRYDFPTGSVLTEEQFHKIEDRREQYVSGKMEAVERKKAMKKIRKS